MERKPYPTDVSDDEWVFIAPYVTLMRQDAPQRDHDLRDVLNALRWIVRAGAPWRMLPNDFPPWHAVYDQTQRWLKAGVFETMVHDLRALLRMAEGHAPDPSAVILDSRTLQSTPESGERAGYDGAKRKKGSKVHIAVDTLGHLLALRVTPATEQDRAQVGALAKAVQAVTEKSVELAYVDQGYTGEKAAQAAEKHKIQPRSSNSAKRNAALCCCPAGGSWSAASRGRPAFGGWPKIMSGCPLPWRDCILSSLLPYCSPGWRWP